MTTGGSRKVPSWSCDGCAVAVLLTALRRVHTDIKPSNVLFDEEGNVYLSDFSVGHGVDLQS
jgi:serine/threonine protein kinase